MSTIKISGRVFLFVPPLESGIKMMSGGWRWLIKVSLISGRDHFEMMSPEDKCFNSKDDANSDMEKMIKLVEERVVEVTDHKPERSLTALKGGKNERESV